MLRFKIVVVMVGFVIACSSINERPDGGTTGGDGGGSGGGDAGANGSNSPDTFMSGTRIKARATTTTTTTIDGAKNTSRYFSGWFDSMRGDACSPLTAADGKTRCLPTSIPGGTYFADAACAQAMGQATVFPPACATTPPPETPKYVSMADVNACNAPRVHVIGARLMPTTYYYKAPMTMACTSAGTPPYYYQFYAIGAEVPAGQFAEMTMTTTVE